MEGTRFEGVRCIPYRTGLWLMGIVAIATISIVLCEMVYQYILIPKMEVYPVRLPMMWKLLWFVPLLLVVYLGMLCRTGIELVVTSVVVGGLNVVFEFIIAGQAWPGHLKSYAMEVPLFFAVVGLTCFSLFYLAILGIGYTMKWAYLESYRRFRSVSGPGL